MEFSLVLCNNRCAKFFYNTNTSRHGRGLRVVVSTAAFHAGVPGSFPGLGGLKETKMFLPHPLVKLSSVGGLGEREVACSAPDLMCHLTHLTILRRFNLACICTKVA